MMMGMEALLPQCKPGVLAMTANGTAHKAPFLEEGDHRVIKPGMVFSIEPDIYPPENGGFRHSCPVLITPEGNRNMTPWPNTPEDLALPI